MFPRFYILLALLCCLCCKQGAKTYYLDGRPYKLEEGTAHKPCVFVFLSPECPLSQSYTLAIRMLADTYKDKVAFQLVFPGKDVKKEDVESFISKYQLQGIQVLLDPELAFTKTMGASITPQAVLLDKKLATRYSGQIDNWAVSVSEKRQVVSAFYLQDAIKAILNDMPVKISHTDAVGCFIE